ncbi:MAG: AIR synthase [Chloroflexi bacterium]|nr:AIR synthase [Chloroflexota bacterium]
MSLPILPVGKLPISLLQQVIKEAPQLDERILLGPGIGMDCAVIDLGSRCLVIKSDPITFASDQIGWYAVQINANDIATTGARPQWFSCTLLLPEGKTTPADVLEISRQINQACRDLGISVVGGHTEITYNLDRPLVLGTLIGEVEKERLVTPRGAQPGDVILLTKGVPVEAVSILAREFAGPLRAILSEEEIQTAAGYLTNPGIGITRDAQIALRAGRVNAMHDPTEGGLAAALWELADASATSLVIELETVHILPLGARICQFFKLDPLATIASGALLLTVPESDASAIISALQAEGIHCAAIGRVHPGPSAVHEIVEGRTSLLKRPDRDDIGRVYAQE